jgi:hypothetical protein
MGARVIRKRGASAARHKAESRAIASIIAAVGLPVMLAYILVAADMRSDLSGLKPAQAVADTRTALIGWPELETADLGKRSSGPASFDIARGRPRARMLGYMMDAYKPSRDGERVEMFVLLPEAGQFLHPAHRIPDQMVEVWLTRPAPFTYRRLVWASGVLTRTPGRRDSDKALYAMADSIIENADDHDIARWFRP